MASSTLLGCWQVEQNLASFDLSLLLVAIGAAHVLVHTNQWERGSMIVIEQRGPPFQAVVTVTATAWLLRAGKLRCVYIFVAVFALGRRLAEIHIGQPGLQVRRLMAAAALDRAMRPHQRKFRRLVIEARKVFPCFFCVTSLTAGDTTGRSRFLHALGKLPLVRIGMARGACQILPVIHGCRFRLERFVHLMTLIAGHGHVASRDHETGLLVLGQGEVRWLVIFDGMTALALPQVRRAGKLSQVLVSVAVRAQGKLKLVERSRSLRDVAFGALYARVLTLKRIPGRFVFGQTELRRLPFLYGVAPGAFPAVRTFGKLSAMRIRPVAIRTLGKR